MRVRGIVLAVLAMSGLAQAQTVARVAPQLRAANPAIRQVDPLALLQSRLTHLEHRVNALESTINKTQPALSFQCVDNVTSQNSVGVAEDCTPYACAPIDGRCRLSAKTSSDCAPGYNWIEGGGCIAAGG